MESYCPEADGQEPARARALNNFVDMTKQTLGQQPADEEPPCGAAGDCQIAGWNVEVELDARFTPFVLSTLPPMLPNVPPPLPTLRLEHHWIDDLPGVTVVTNVSGRSEWCARWVPILCPHTHKMLLIALDRSRTASLQADGTLNIVGGLPPLVGGLNEAAEMFYDRWRRGVPLMNPRPKPVVGQCELGAL